MRLGFRATRRARGLVVARDHPRLANAHFGILANPDSGLVLAVENQGAVQHHVERVLVQNTPRALDTVAAFHLHLLIDDRGMLSALRGFHQNRRR
jgi:hypothetical protein